VSWDNVTAEFTENYSINFHVRIILESNPIPARCDWKRVLQSWMRFNENRVICGLLLRLEAIRIELRYLAFAVRLQLKLQDIQ
jgi:hypothetical protein